MSRPEDKRRLKHFRSRCNGSEVVEGFPFREIFVALRTGKCPHCGFVLVVFQDLEGSGLRCSSCHWEYFSSDVKGGGLLL